MLCNRKAMEDQAINLSKKSELFLIKNILNLSNCATTIKQSNYSPKTSASSAQNGLQFFEQGASERPSLSKVDQLMFKEKRNKQSKSRQLNNQVVDLSLVNSRSCKRFKFDGGQEKGEEKKQVNKDELALQERQESRRRNRRTMFSEWQLSSLEWRFSRNKYLTTTDRKHIAKLLALNQLQVKTWFQVSNFIVSKEVEVKSFFGGICIKRR